MGSPFATQQVVAGPFFTDRDAEVKRVRHALQHAGKLVVYGERRMGKTSLIARACSQLEAQGGVVLRADAWGAGTLDDVNAKLFAALPALWLLGDRLQLLLEGLRQLAVFSIDDQGRPTLKLSGQARDRLEPAQRLERLLRGVERVAAGSKSPVVVWVDEFQRLEDLAGAGTGLVRSAVQESPHVAYVFSGSIVGLIETLIGPRGALHAIDRLQIGEIEGEHMVRWLQDRMRSHGVKATRATLRYLHSRSGPVTEYVVKLAKEVFRLAQPAGSADDAAVDQAFGEIVADFAGSFELIWARLSQAKQQVLRALAAGEEQVTSAEVVERYGLGSSGTVVWAINELRAEAHLAPFKPYRISNPYFAHWIRDYA